MATKKYLDKDGLQYFWSKIKSWVTSRGYITSSGSITGNAATATRLGTSTVGSSVQPIYLESGKATAVKSALKTCYGGVESEAVANTFFKIASGSISGSYNHLKVQILVQHITGKNSCIWDIWLSTGRTAGVYSQGHSILFNSTGYYGVNLIVAYKSNSGGNLDFELYVEETARYSNHRFTVIQECWRSSQKVGDILTLYNQLTTTGTSTITSGYTALTTTVGTVSMNINGSSTSCSGNAGTATKLATSRTISLTGDVSGSVSFDGSANASITATVADDSHNHVISNVDGLQTALDGKIELPANVSNPERTVLCADGVWRDISQIAFPL